MEGKKKRQYHGMNRTRPYNIFMGILKRCNNKKCINYSDYGGRGIKVEWTSFIDFWRDMKDGYADDLCIERINNDGNYSKENCKWATWKEQMNNQRKSHWLVWKGRRQTMAAWAAEIGMKYSTLRSRINLLKMPVGKALTTKIKNHE